MKERIEIYDVTDRDGAQAHDVKLELDDKVHIARLSDAMGFNAVEVGFPGSNHTDRRIFDVLRDHPLEHAKVAAFGMMRRKDTLVENDEAVRLLTEVPADIVTLVGKSSRFQVDQVLRATADENERMIEETIRFLREHGKEDVLYDAEHFFDGFYGTENRHGIPDEYKYPGDPKYALRTLEAAARAGARGIVLCDTNGYSSPEQVYAATEGVRKRLGNVLIGIHPHNDRGLATANMLAAVRAGARHIQGTWNGLGERTGNLDLTTALPNLMLEGYDVPDLRQLKHSSEEAARFTRQEVRSDRPFVGMRAYAHKGGIHASGVERMPAAYEGMPPAIVGNERIIVGSEQAGLASIRSVAERLRCLPEELRQQILTDPEYQRTILAAVKERERKGCTFDRADASITILILETVGDYERKITEEDLPDVHDRVGGSTTATVEMKINGTGEIFHEVSRGGGPLGALDSALRKALVQRYPELRKHTLFDYHAKPPPTSRAGTSSIIQVVMECTDGTDHWFTTGADTDSTKAGWDALLDSYEYLLLKRAAEAEKEQNKSVSEVK